MDANVRMIHKVIMLQMALIKNAQSITGDAQSAMVSNR